MAITLRIDNFDQLPDGGPVEFTATNRGFDIGRQPHMDWCLPDPARVISGLHCQVRYEGGSYWLHDVSRNGTFVEGMQGRVNGPLHLQDGMRLRIGHYFVTVRLGAADFLENPVSEPVAAMRDYSPDDLWTMDAPPPSLDRKSFTPRPSAAPAPDVLGDFVSLPQARAPENFGSAPWGDRAPASRAAPPPSGEMTASAFIAAMANAAGVSPQAFSTRPPEQLAAEVGAVLRMATEQLTGLLHGRAQVKLMTKSTNRTMISAQNNNPLKFIRDASEALEVMFAQSTAGYLGAAASFKDGFDNIRAHEIATYSAMQSALARIMDELSPDTIEEKAGGGPFGSKKAKAWELYVQRWDEKTESENGALDLFLAYFAEAYDKSSKR